MDKSAKIYVSGHRGMVGSALVRALQASGFTNLVTRTREELNLLDQAATNEFLAAERPQFIFMAAAKVGGIQANQKFPAEFIYQNIAIASNIISSAHKHGIDRLCFLGSSCIYPRNCPQPIREDYLLTGPLEPTNEPYAVAKIAGIKLCESYNHQFGRKYFSVMPTNLYGPGDNYNLTTSHVLPALIRKAHEAKQRGDSELTIWGTGKPRREFLYVDDLARACVYLMEIGVEGGLINIGTGVDVTIRELAHLVMDVIGFKGTISFDLHKPDGTPRKLLDVSYIQSLGWNAQVNLQEGISLTYQDFLHSRPRLTGGI